MLSLIELFNTFLGKRPVELLAKDNISLKDGVISLGLAFAVASALLFVEIVLARVIIGFLGSEELVALAIGLAITIIALLVLFPILFILEIIAYYVFGAALFLVAGLYRKERGDLNHFNGSFVTVMASVRFVAGLLLLVPVIGWLAAAVAKLYGVVLSFRFVREHFNLTDAQSAIVVLVPVNFALGVLLVIVTAISFLLIGSRIL